MIRMVKEGKVESINGNDIAIKADSICVHGDNPKALEFVKNIREPLIAEGVEIKHLRFSEKACSCLTSYKCQTAANA